MKYLHLYTLAISKLPNGATAVISFESDNAIPTTTEFFRAVGETPEIKVAGYGTITLSKQQYSILNHATFLNQ